MEMYLENGWLVDVKEQAQSIPTEFALRQNFPNPFNPATTVQFSLPRVERVRITVYGILGKMVGQILDEVREAGEYTVHYTPTNLASGTYLYRMEAGEFIAVRRFLLIK